VSPELFTSLANTGALALLCYYLWRQNQRLTDELYAERQRHRDELAELRGEITKRDRERFRESSNYATTLWQILTATNTIAEHVRRQTRFGSEAGDGQDDL
jgi:hypothetical protein